MMAGPVGKRIEYACGYSKKGISRYSKTFREDFCAFS